MAVTIIERVYSPGGWESRAARLFAWTGALLFAASLGYFLFTYALTFGESEHTAPLVPATTWNFGLFTVFALHHSVFARTRVRLFVARTVPAALERSVYVWIASLLFIAVCALWRPVPGTAWSVAPPAGYLLYLLMAAGVWLSVRSAAVIDIWELAGVRQTREHDRVASGPATTVAQWEFKATGPYGVVRHPIYLGWVLMVWGVPVMTGTRLTFALISCGYLLMAIPFEEKTLREASGGKYDAYMRAVPWKLLPGLY
jgi:protein-S-isoprenylcysteine O-methyltransferase Ste14